VFSTGNLDKWNQENLKEKKEIKENSSYDSKGYFEF
jgi:hypothetical protein